MLYPYRSPPLSLPQPPVLLAGRGAGALDVVLGELNTVVCGGVPPWLLEYIIYVISSTSNLCESV
jgi:hypothetical protein